VTIGGAVPGIPPEAPGESARPRSSRMSKTPRSTILVVDDEEEICDLVRYNLTREGYRVVVEHDGEAGLDRVFKSPPDLVVLDLLLPKLSGLEVLHAIRKETRVHSLPVLVLTARGTEMDKLIGFERGADDYMTKPFSPKELVARVAAILRRTRGEQPEQPTKIGPFEFDRERHLVRLHGRELHLTPTEFRLLEFLLQRPGRVFSREQLLDKVWGLGYFGETRTVDVHVRRLRAKLGRDSGLIRTVTGVGYAAEVKKS
ncbi:MAG TPA: response regulator transcription factor, partial [Candidatus Eisenbacteria bacterium]